jgi:hypothetical protein
MSYVDRGWDVVPGAYLASGRFHCSTPNCPTVACHPAVPRWEEAASRESGMVAAWWAELPYSILLATGRAFDALEVPAELGRMIAGQVEGPVIATPAGRWFFLVRAGDGLRPELQLHLGVLLHGLGSWIPAPPNRQLGGKVRWESHPTDAGDRLPDSYEVQRQLLAALRTLTADRTGRPLVQLEWTGQAA